MTGQSAPSGAMEQVSSSPEAQSGAAPALGVAAGQGTLLPWSLGSHRERAQKPLPGGSCLAQRTGNSSLGSVDLLFSVAAFQDLGENGVTSALA